MSKKLNKRASRKNATPMIFSENLPFAVKEGYKGLRTNIAFSLPNEGCVCVGVTSPDRGDGKSTTLINTALSCSQIFKKSLIIDSDLRLPTVSEKLSIERTPGLTNYLVKEVGLDDIITSYSDYVDIIPAGNIPRDPTGLLESKKLSNMIEKLKERYDYIFIDLPPINTVTDAAIMSKNVDGFIVVVSHGISKYKNVSEALKKLQFVNAKILGIVYNNAPINVNKYSGYYGKTKA